MKVLIQILILIRALNLLINQNNKILKTFNLSDPNIELSGIVGPEIAKLVDPKFKLESMLFAANMILIVVSRVFFIKDLLLTKNSSLIKELDFLKDKEDNEYKWDLKGIYVLNDDKNLILNSNKFFDKTTILIAHHEDNKCWDFECCKKFILDYEEEQITENEEYFFDGL